MVRVLILFGVIAALSASAIWLADNPGELTILWRGYEVRASFITGLFAISFATFLVLLAYRLFATFMKSPAGFTSFLASRRRRKGYKALSRSMVAIAAGDAHEADVYAAQAHRLLNEPAMTLLLAAQAAQLRGDAAGATKFFEEMRTHEETAFLGLRGLYVQAERGGDKMAALDYAQQAFQLRPHTEWAAEASFVGEIAAGSFEAAAATLDQMLQVKLITRDVGRRRRAVLLTAQAMGIVASGDVDSDAVPLLTEAVELEPDFAPAVALLARLVGERGDIKKAARVIERAWATRPHPDLADVYLTLVPGELPRDRVRRVKSLAARNPGAGESYMALARAAIAADDFTTAREAMNPLVARAPTVRVCELMAALETAEGEDKEAARGWLARALAAPADPCWIGDHYQSEDWVAIVPGTNKFDQLVWQVPPAKQGSRPALIPMTVPQEAGETDEEILAEMRVTAGVKPLRNFEQNSEQKFEENSEKNSSVVTETPVSGSTSDVGAASPPSPKPADRATVPEHVVVAPDDPGIFDDENEGDRRA
ncbi:MAG: heme biosynthesis HemY N-terminal domain-containing protein [Parvibaculum sp.]